MPEKRPSLHSGPTIKLINRVILINLPTLQRRSTISLFVIIVIRIIFVQIHRIIIICPSFSPKATASKETYSFQDHHTKLTMPVNKTQNNLESFFFL